MGGFCFTCFRPKIILPTLVDLGVCKNIWGMMSKIIIMEASWAGHEDKVLRGAQVYKVVRKGRLSRGRELYFFICLHLRRKLPLEIPRFSSAKFTSVSPCAKLY